MVGLAAGDVLRRVVAPSAFVFLLFVAMLATLGVTWPRASQPAAEGAGACPAISRLGRYLLVTAVAGYTIFLAIVAVFHVLIGGGPVSVIGDAASGGALLAFGIAVPVYVGVEALARRRSR